jgi:hypothetical protein
MVLNIAMLFWNPNTSDSVILINFPGAVCQDCIDSVLNRVPDPPGLMVVFRICCNLILFLSCIGVNAIDSHKH